MRESTTTYVYRFFKALRFWLSSTRCAPTWSTQFTFLFESVAHHTPCNVLHQIILSFTIYVILINVYSYCALTNNYIHLSLFKVQISNIYIWICICVYYNVGYNNQVQISQISKIYFELPCFMLLFYFPNPNFSVSSLDNFRKLFFSNEAHWQ